MLDQIALHLKLVHGGASGVVAPFFALLDRLIPDPRQPNPDPFAFPFLGHPIHGLDQYPHGSSEYLEVAERGVGHAEGVHQHDCPRRPIPLSLVDG